MASLLSTWPFDQVARPSPGDRAVHTHPLCPSWGVVFNQGGGVDTWSVPFGLQDSTLQNLGTDTTWANTEVGSAVQFISNDGYLLGPLVDSVFKDLTTCTVVWAWEKTDGSNRISSAWGTNINTPNRLNTHWPFSDGAVYFDWGDTGSGGRISQSGLSFGNDVYATVVTAGLMEIWQNGLRVANTTASSTRSSSSSTPLWIGKARSSSDRARCRFFYVYDGRRLISQEIQSITQSPYQFYEQATYYWYSTEVLGGQTITATGVPSQENIGLAGVSPGDVMIAPGGTGSLENLGDVTVSAGGLILEPPSILASDGLGNPSVSPGLVTVNPSSILTGELFGAPQLSFIVSPSSVASAEALGAAIVNPGGVSVVVTAIDSLESVGLTVVSSGDVLLQPSAIAGAELVGVAALVPGTVSIDPSGVVTTELVGPATVSAGALALLPNAIASLEGHGAHALTLGGITVVPAGIAGLEVFGGATVALHLQLLSPTGVASVDAFGTPVMVVGSGLQAMRVVDAYQRRFIFDAHQRLFVFDVPKR